MLRCLLDDPFDHHKQSLESDVNQDERARFYLSDLLSAVRFCSLTSLFLFSLSRYDMRRRSARKSHIKQLVIFIARRLSTSLVLIWRVSFITIIVSHFTFSEELIHLRITMHTLLRTDRLFDLSKPTQREKRRKQHMLNRTKKKSMVSYLFIARQRATGRRKMAAGVSLSVSLAEVWLVAMILSLSASYSCIAGDR